MQKIVYCCVTAIYTATIHKGFMKPLKIESTEDEVIITINKKHVNREFLVNFLAMLQLKFLVVQPEKKEEVEVKKNS